MSTRSSNRRAPASFYWDSLVCLTTRSNAQYVLVFEQLYKLIYPDNICVICQTYKGYSSYQLSFNHLVRRCEPFRDGGFRLSVHVPTGTVTTDTVLAQVRDELSDFLSAYEAQIPDTIYSRALDSDAYPGENGRFPSETVSKAPTFSRKLNRKLQFFPRY